MDNRRLHITTIPPLSKTSLANPEYQKDLSDLKALLLPYDPGIPVTIKDPGALVTRSGDLTAEIFIMGVFIIPHAALFVTEIAQLLINWKKATGLEVVIQVEVDGVKSKAQAVEQIEELFQ